MMSTKVLTSGLIAGTLVLGAVGQAEAADLVRSWQAVEAQSSEYNGSGGHAFWLPDMISGGVFVFDGEAAFNEYDDGSANFVGSIVAANDANKTWDFDIWFEASEEGWGGPKTELLNSSVDNSSPYAENGPVDTDTWWYYNFSSTQGSFLTSDSGEYAGQTLELFDWTDGQYPVQIGEGANGKNIEMGMATWFGYEGSQNSTQNADINISLIAQDIPQTEDYQEVPEPVSGLLSLGLLGFAASNLKRKQQ